MRRRALISIALLTIVAAAMLGLHQALVTEMPGQSYAGELPPLTPAQLELSRRLEADVTALAGTIGERNLFRPAALERAARHIEESFEAAGHRVVSHEYVVNGRTVRNIELAIAGEDPASGIVVVGAHYDSIRGSPGANDNASGVAALLEVARSLRGRAFARGLRLVAFVNEEPPFFYTGSMGSVQYVGRLLERGEKVMAMLSLETLGYYSDAPGSQRYPFPLSYYYSDTGNFIGFVANLSSQALLRRMVKTFRDNARFPSEGLAAPAWLRGVDWSDHSSFWRRGIPAVMVTDTALFRYHEYHTAEDTPGILAYERFARVVDGLVAVIIDLASDDESSQ